MKNTEIRIGNYIYRNDILVTVDEQTFWDMKNNPEQYNPVPITEGSLIKLGFVVTDDYGDQVYYAVKGYGNRHFYVCLDHEQISFGLSVFNEITGIFWDDEKLQDIHQLQNLYFALTNQELKA
jgi:hypothetical protein